MRIDWKSLAWLALVSTIAMVATACATPALPATPSATPTTLYRAPSYAEITPGPKKIIQDLSTTIEVPPFPFSAPLPPSEPTIVDGLYSKRIPMEGTPTPCKRCAGYRLEGGVWTLYLNRGIYKIFHLETGFESVGSYAVSNSRITFFNDPYCEEDLAMIGNYEWELDARGSLRLRTAGDRCSYGLRAKNLTYSPWVQTPLTLDERRAACQPPNREAAISDHWFKPPFCE